MIEYLLLAVIIGFVMYRLTRILIRVGRTGWQRGVQYVNQKGDK